MSPPTAVQPESCRQMIRELRALAIRSLPRMYRKEDGIFAFRLRHDGRDRLEGHSVRYSAIVAIALARENADVAREVLCGDTLDNFMDRLCAAVETETDIGAVALTLWAARVCNHDGADRILEHLRTMDPVAGAHPTVEHSWCVTALVVDGGDRGIDAGLADAAAQRLLDSQHPSGLFAHRPAGAGGQRWRDHVCCFADFVYPIQALSHYFTHSGRSTALDAARSAARKMIDLQGPAGQWWWHFDIRSGRALEGYPVYAVHQDAMAPMALYALPEAAGIDIGPAIKKSLAWLHHAPELNGSLIDEQVDVVWRKVARREPGKLVRSLQAAISRLHPSLRVPGVGVVCPPGRIDAETRPYHMGWLLYAFGPEWDAA